MWRRWESVAAFDAWHASAKAALGIPRPGINQATGEVDDEAQWTTACTTVVRVAADDWRAFVEESVAELVPDSLGALCDPPPSPEFP
jgi:hypothetical protein